MTWDENILWTFKIHLHVFGPLASSLIMLQKKQKKTDRYLWKEISIWYAQIFADVGNILSFCESDLLASSSSSM